MADQKDIQNQKDLNNEMSQTKSNQKDINNEMSQTKSFEEQIIDLLQQRRGITSDVLSSQQDISNVLQDQVKQQKFLTSEKKLARDISNQITKISQEAYSISQDELGLTQTNSKLKKQQETLEKNIILAKQQQAKFSKMALEGTIESRELNAEIARSLGEQAKQAQIVSNQISTIARESKLTSEALGVKTFGGLSDLAKSVPGLQRFSGPFQEAAEAARKHGAAQAKMLSTGKGLTGDKIKELGLTKKLTVIQDDGTKKLLTGRAAANKLQKDGVRISGTMTAGFKSLGPAIAKAFGPIALATTALNMIVKAFKSADQSAGQLAKSQGISYEEARKFNQEIADSGVTSGKLLTTTKDVVAAQIELNKIFGTSLKFSNEFAAEFSEIQKRTGLSGHAMELFAEKAFLSGTSIQDQLEKVTAVTQELNAQNKISISAKDIQEGIGQMSASQILNNRMNTKEMANQVFQAKMLGISQQQLEGVQSKLLDFESSISAEMEAELLTGKQLNLEGARAAALAGDQAKLAAELRKEVGTAAEFGAMNVIQQEAMAKAFGLSRDDMSKMLIEQEKLASLQKAFGGDVKTMGEAQAEYNRLSAAGELTEKKKKELAEAGVLDQLESVSQQEKLTAITEKLTDLFIQLADPLIPVISKIMDIGAAVIQFVAPAFKMLGKVVEGIMFVLQPVVDAFMLIGELIGSFFDPTQSFFDILGEADPIVQGLAVAFGIIGTALLISIVPAIATAVISMGALAIEAGIAAIAIVAQASAMTLGIGAIAIAAGIATVVAAMNSAEPAGDMFSPADGRTQVSTKEGGLFELSPNDDFMAAPGISNMMSSSNSTPSSTPPATPSPTSNTPQQGTTQSNQQLVELNAKMSRLISIIEKGGDVIIDGAKVGKSLVLASSKIG